MQPKLTIQNREISKDHTPLVIAEIGINHSGSLEIAKAMVDSAYRAGVEVVKHQTHIVADEMSNLAKETIPGNASKSIYDIMDECSLSEDEEYQLMQYVKSKGMIFISTPFGREAANRLANFNIPAFKIGSGECNNLPLLEHISSFGKPIILSTGMNSLESIEDSVNILNQSNIGFALLHTTNLYPTPNHLVRLGALQEIEQKYNCVVGLSDHTITNHACFAAVALGASILERHFTDTLSRSGPDIICSMDENTCKDLIIGSNIIYEQRGGSKTFISEEQVTRDFAFSTVCTITPVKKGEKFTKENLWAKRPGIGKIPAKMYNHILGKISTKDLPTDYHLTEDDFL